jgi:hypothetical protein
MHTIIGAEAFHGPVRDGKGWGHLAIAAKRNLKTRSREFRVIHYANLGLPLAKNGRSKSGLNVSG